MKKDAYKVFIDGREGTTGLRIEERLAARDDVEFVVIDPALRKDALARAACLNACDFAFLCLPDGAATEAVAMVQNPNVRIIDASTAHRTNPDWTYGFAELAGRRDIIANSKRVAVPGCYASGFLALVAPLTEKGKLAKSAGLFCFGLSGYSGAGKKMIEAFNEPTDEMLSPRGYALGQQHKHLREMQAIAGLEMPPIFCPTVCDYYSGMTVTVPFFVKDLAVQSKAELLAFYRTYYQGSHLVKVTDESVTADGFVAANTLSGKDDMELIVAGNDERITVTARFDNLGKGASGVAVQCFNIMTGQDETTGLQIREQRIENREQRWRTD